MSLIPLRMCGVKDIPQQSSGKSNHPFYTSLLCKYPTFPQLRWEAKRLAVWAFQKSFRSLHALCSLYFMSEWDLKLLKLFHEYSRICYKIAWIVVQCEAQDTTYPSINFCSESVFSLSTVGEQHSGGYCR